MPVALLAQKKSSETRTRSPEENNQPPAATGVQQVNWRNTPFQLRLGRVSKGLRCRAHIKSSVAATTRIASLEAAFSLGLTDP